MDSDSPTGRPRPKRQPLLDVANRINIPQTAAERLQDISPSLPLRKHSLAIKSSDLPNLHSAPSPPGAAAENTRLSAVAGPQPNSNRNSAISATSTSSGKSRRKTHVGPWQLGRTLGKGATGRVRLAKHAVTGQTAAIKIVS